MSVIRLNVDSIEVEEPEKTWGERGERAMKVTEDTNETQNWR